MKVFLLGVCLSLLPLGVQAQAFFRGNVLISGYGGFPNLMRVNFKNTENLPFGPQLTYSGLAPSGLRAIYMLSDQFGMGLDLMYGQIKGSYSMTEQQFINNQWTNVQTTYTAIKYQFRPQLRMNMHLQSYNPNFDHYYGIGIGFNVRRHRQYLNDSLLIKGKNPEDYTSPVSFRLCYGLHYQLNTQWSVGAEFGLGGPLAQCFMAYRIF
ncbi:MAG: hypothetical protein RLZZ301_894 [Bacteroidota bacterium]|jgi:hypothetical protein